MAEEDLEEGLVCLALGVLLLENGLGLLVFAHFYNFLISSECLHDLSICQKSIGPSDLTIVESRDPVLFVFWVKLLAVSAVG